MQLKVSDLAKVNHVPPARRATKPDELYGGWVRDRESVPEATVNKLIAYANEYELELNAEATDIYPVRQEDGNWFVMVKWSGIERICRATNLWKPGRSEMTMVGKELFATASCHVRQGPQDKEWHEVSAFARYTSYCDRDLSDNDLWKFKPVGDWILTPEVRLDEVAQYNASCKALGEIVTKHNFMYIVPRITIHAAALKKRGESIAPRPVEAAAKA